MAKAAGRAVRGDAADMAQGAAAGGWAGGGGTGGTVAETAATEIAPIKTDAGEIYVFIHFSANTQILKQMANAAARVDIELR